MTRPPDPDHVRPFLQDVEYPISKSGLVAAAERSDVDAEVVRAVLIVPDRTYESQEEVREQVALGS
ncbi:DUF2795 domain-containing protein [Saccharopolyspora griseoalba]|uniref:DUF2795 domain-containing protein n=1 Tax=Saccharopolyspora griseoalba TaxID=1431848 RepID=A0ABW2LQJ0_9PSEU